ncbi:hypothetical protein F441_12447 [Phytophthora nicotianae CJ01A1]|uniref:Uncharacterized protein n=3 Tax=Phytophthora nicotianae TaxID=4792 RepID=W2PZQ0_PHYN3|nr:hypothetical protein PPTG_13146 [Phytophthora nicotianae INRA-310]ETN05749.1 hypothetical protein PPTG_13146 [Phytophthora nicotianae INRA-310]ETP12121.1 hypothetical protein F441_12447 [Phytophthora nicotianae CJ01A1]
MTRFKWLDVVTMANSMPVRLQSGKSQTSAYGNIALGGGFEVLDYYKDTNIMFVGTEIENDPEYL